MAKATRASAERNPNAIRVSSRSFVFTLSTRAFERAVGEGGLDPGTVDGDRFGEFDERRDPTSAGPLQPPLEQGDPGGTLERKHLPELLFEQVCPVETLVGVGDVGERGRLALGEILRILPQRIAGILQFSGHRLLAVTPGRVPGGVECFV
jgi:hypothetical protein